MLRPTSAATVAQDREERAAAQLVVREAGARERLLLADRTGIEGAQEVVEQRLPGGRVVEDFTDERRLRRAVNEVAQPLARRVEPAEEEGVNRGVSAHELPGVQIPTLIEPAR